MGEAAAVDHLLREAAEHYGAGRRDRAEALCGNILTADPDHLAALHLSAIIAFVTDRAAEGARLLNRVFTLAPDHAPALATLGDALAVKGEREGAVDAFTRAVARQPQDATLHAKLGAALCGVSRFDEAEAAYRHAIALNPDSTRSRFNLAVALAGQERLAEAEAAYRDVIARDPAHPGVWLNLGTVLADQKKFDEAIAAYRHALTVDPYDSILHVSLGSALRQQGQLDESVIHFRRASTLDPDNLAAFRLLGLVLHEVGQVDEAAHIFRQVSTRDPGDVESLTNLGACLCALGQVDDAIAACDLALALNPHHAPAHTNMGILLDMQNDFEAAVAAHRRAVEANPSYAQGYANLAVALGHAGEVDEALEVSRRAIALDPDKPQTRFNHSHALLMSGNLLNGFVEHRWGRKCKGSSVGFPDLPGSEWEGEPLAGRTLLLYAEFGIGDALQFVRYLPMIAAKERLKESSEGGSIVLQVQPGIAPLLRTMPGVTVVSRGEPLPPFDVHLPLMDLPRIFRTTLDSIPAEIPYLHVDPVKLARWRHALDKTSLLKVGVVWAGNPLHKSDRFRSLSAEVVLPRLITPGVQLFSLQMEPRPEDVRVLTGLRADVIDLARAIDDFTDTAAVVSALDLVIAVDTSVVHLAGAIGRPVWVLLPHALDWRWMHEREDTPWYPTVRLFRQHKTLAWDGVLSRVSAELARVAAGERGLIWPPAMRTD
jgi:tetratricopeptide (TPR) repeat protein